MNSVDSLLKHPFSMRTPEEKIEIKKNRSTNSRFKYYSINEEKQRTNIEKIV